MDAVYILGTGSLAENKEILYSVRSLSKHMSDLRDVYVIGEKPVNLQGAIHIEMRDPTNEKWKNAYFKIVQACKLPSLSDEFLLMNDDFFMLSDFIGAEFPFYALKGSNGGTCGMNSFHVHCPVRLSKEFYLNMPFSVDQKACRSPRTFYANYFRATPTFIDDVIVRAGKGCRDLNEQIAGLKFFSTGDQSFLSKELLDFMERLYPTKSRFE